MQEKFQYGYSFQTKLIACLFKDRAFLQQIMDILDPVYFEFLTYHYQGLSP